MSAEYGTKPRQAELALDIETLRDRARGAVYAECLRISRQLRQPVRQVIGLLPVGPDVAVLPLAIQFGLALQDLTRARVAVIDGNVAYPAVLGRRKSSAGPARIGVDGVVVGRQVAPPSSYGERWLTDFLVLLSPCSIEGPGALVPELKLVIERCRASYEHLLVDLTGFEQVGDHLNAIALLDGVIVVARAGASTEADLVRMKAQLPPQRTLGVVLTG